MEMEPKLNFLPVNFACHLICDPASAFETFSFDPRRASHPGSKSGKCMPRYIWAYFSRPRAAKIQLAFSTHIK